MTMIYHLAPAERWHTWPAHEPYLPSEYEQDGFIHCTAGDELMLRVANRFYRGAEGGFVLLVIDPKRLTSELRWEKSEDDDLAPLFPHTYGPIDRAAILEVRAVKRTENGTFLGW
jgi:uncharacterized protein (DUF952 family)